MKTYKISNKQRVIEVAANLFIQKGYTYTSMDEVVQKSEVSKSNVYYHFSNKEELLLAVIDYWIDAYQIKIEEMLEQNNLSLKKRMVNFLNSLGDSVEQRNYQGSCPFITFIIQTPKDDLIVQEKVNGFFDYLILICTDLIEQGIEANELKPDINAKEVAELFVNNLEGALFLAEIKKNKQLITATAESLFKLLVLE
ncbi:TetR/AcrR family transcriptional regulator [Lactococcus lactis]|jgi:AcrR family transcriptional regulator|uniref:TetR/AcrR family transcriptional regulator n=1 Tax=Lactococcus lactis TaxID=1358 RepID=UPI001F5313B9|nr:TetR/AcrR family transcriptional regulator [Lactococcus lactis]MCI1072197.1 TetR/AcrR family transcriptional regulator [Lactococcus lactis]MCQ4970718.1 TetR/AcrR family transcriptional regulator [Lactococcus lactis]MCQ4996526.1 TetR/AcrR family transcriptional regulator [Lactococcus lactis]